MAALLCGSPPGPTGPFLGCSFLRHTCLTFSARTFFFFFWLTSAADVTIKFPGWMLKLPHILPSADGRLLLHRCLTPESP